MKFSLSNSLHRWVTSKHFDWSIYLVLLVFFVLLFGLIHVFGNVTINYPIREVIVKVVAPIFYVFFFYFCIVSFLNSRVRSQEERAGRKILKFVYWFPILAVMPLVFAWMFMQCISIVLMMFVKILAEEEERFYKHCTRSEHIFGGIIFEHVTGEGLIAGSSHVFTLYQGKDRCDPHQVYVVTGRKWGEIGVVWDSYSKIHGD